MEWSFEHGMVVRRIGVGPRVVWVHGLGESSVSFEPLIAAMPGFSHVLVDLPGYGRSPWPEKSIGLEELAEQLAAWLPSNAFVIGHSMGGVLATLIGERREVEGIVDIDGNLSRGDCNISGIAAAIDDPVRALETVREAMRDAPRSYQAALGFAMPAMFHRHARELVAISSTETLAGRLAKQRSLFVAGVPNGVCAASCALLDRAGARWVGVEPAGHWVYLDQPQQFAEQVTAFLQAG